jgi:hypothetical protein
MRVRTSPDIVSGLFFSAAAAIGIVLSSRLELGSPSRMGPGFFPMGLSLILLVLGAIVLLRALLQRDPETIGDVKPRPLVIVLAAVVLFSLLVERWSFALAAALLIVVARLATDRFRPVEVAVLTLGLVAFSAGVFLFALKLPLRLLPL